MNRNQQQIYQDVHGIVESLKEIVEILKDEQKINNKNKGI